MAYEEQQQNAYAEVLKLGNMLPLKYKNARNAIKEFLNFFNSENWKQ